MLIVCAGPNSYRAKEKSRGLVASFKEKYDKTGKSIDTLNPANQYSDVIGRLSSPSLFSVKTMLVCSGLMDGLNVAQTKTLAKALATDQDQTVVLDYEAKKLTQKTVDYFAEKSLIVYAFDQPEGAELRKEVAAMCGKYGLRTALADKLIAIYSDDLWSIDTALQALGAVGGAADLSSAEGEANVFQTVESIMSGNQGWRKDASRLDAYELLNTLVSQFRSWNMVQSGTADGVHPYVQKKMSRLRIADSEMQTLQAFRALYASRSSLAGSQEIENIIF